MARVYNFSSGPAAIPEAVLIQAQQELLEWNQTGSSVMELSHRGKPFMALAAESEQDLRDLMQIPDHYKVLFLQGGATTQFALLPMNFAYQQAVDYIITGAWGEKACKEARFAGQVNVAASSADMQYADIPKRQQWQLDSQAAYVHITSNETIGGVQFHQVPEVGNVPLIADMSSDILSRPCDVSKYGVIYAGVQKNIGAAGLVIMIIREDLLTRCPPHLPNILNYAAHAKENSLLNTPNTFGWYLSSLVFKWLKSQGGLAAMQEKNAEKAALLYEAIDHSGFYHNRVAQQARSLMNVPFQLADQKLDILFLKESEAQGLVALKGHRSVGGMRASIYNAMPLDGVCALINFMQDFEQRHG